MQSIWLLCCLVLLLSPETSASCTMPSFHTNSTFGKNPFTFVYGSIFKVVSIFDCDDLDDFEYIIYWERSFRTDKHTNVTMKNGVAYIDNGPPHVMSPSFEMTLSVSYKTKRKDANHSRILVREKLSGYETRSPPIMLICCTMPSFHTNSTFGKNPFTFVYGSIFKVVSIFDCDDLDDFEYIIYWERSFRTDKHTNVTMKNGVAYIDNGPPHVMSPSFEMTLSVSYKTKRKDANHSRILVREKLSGYETRSPPIMLIYPTPTTTSFATTTTATTTTTTSAVTPTTTTPASTTTSATTTTTTSAATPTTFAATTTTTSASTTTSAATPTTAAITTSTPASTATTTTTTRNAATPTTAATTTTTTPTSSTTTSSTPSHTAAATTRIDGQQAADNTVVILAITLPCGVVIFSLILVIVILRGRRMNRRYDLNEQLQLRATVEPACDSHGTDDTAVTSPKVNSNVEVGYAAV